MWCEGGCGRSPRSYKMCFSDIRHQLSNIFVDRICFHKFWREAIIARTLPNGHVFALPVFDHSKGYPIYIYVLHQDYLL